VKPRKLEFQSPKHLHSVNCVLYVDFETRFHQISPERLAQKILRLGSSCNAISVGWHAVGRDGFEGVLEQPDMQQLRSGFMRADGSEDDAHITEEAVFKWLQLAEQHTYKQNVHKDFCEASLTFEEAQNHEEASRCYVCCLPFSVERKKVHDHCHGTGKYRGPACGRATGR
jgi:hypothetical protein